MPDFIVALAILAFIVALAFGIALFMRQNEINRNLYPAEGRLAPPAAKPRLRKLVLYGAFLLLGVAFLFGEPLAHWVANQAYGVHDLPGADEASAALVAANARVGGWVPVGTATSKIILAISFYVLSYIIPWVVQQATHPAPTRWAKRHYSADFNALPAEKKFEVNGRISLNQSIRLACSLLAAALIQ